MSTVFKKQSFITDCSYKPVHKADKLLNKRQVRRRNCTDLFRSFPPQQTHYGTHRVAPDNGVVNQHDPLAKKVILVGAVLFCHTHLPHARRGLDEGATDVGVLEKNLLVGDPELSPKYIELYCGNIQFGVNCSLGSGQHRAVLW